MSNDRSGTGHFKRTVSIFVVGLLMGVLLMVVLQSRGPVRPKAIESTEKNSFQQVTSRLNRGGSLYFYLSTQQLITSINERFAILKGILMAGKNRSRNQVKESEAGIQLLESIFLNSGLNEISGIGFSQISLENGIQHSKAMLHHYKDSKKGLIWNMFKQEPHAMDSLNMLPTNTVFASFSDCKADYVWKWLKTQVGTSALVPLQKVMVVLDSALTMQGITLDELLPTVDDQLGFVITMDPDKMVPLPGDGKDNMNLPYTSAALVISVKNDKLFNVLWQLLRGPQGNRVPSVNENKFFLPIPGLPFEWKPVIAQHQGFLIFATDEKIISEMWAAKKGSNRLTETSAFKSLALDMPIRGNQFRYIDKRFMAVVRDMFRSGFNGVSPGSTGYGIFDLLNPLPVDFEIFSVLQNMDEGLVITANHNMRAETFMMTPALVTVGAGVLFYALFPDRPSTASLDAPAAIPPEAVEKKATID